MKKLLNFFPFFSHKKITRKKRKSLKWTEIKNVSAGEDRKLKSCIRANRKERKFLCNDK